MRIVLALDGSDCAETARELVGDLSWPPDTVVDAIRVVEPVYDLFSMPGVVFDGPIEEVLGLDEVRRALEGEAAPLARDGLAVSTHVVIGRPATAIMERATEVDADLIVMGSRGRGAIATMVLGSTSAEVAAHAPCPVLVARSAGIHRVLVALDGTPGSDRLVESLAATPFLRDTRMEVLSVAPSFIPGPGVMLSGGYGVPIAWYEESVAAARAALEDVARGAAERLAAAGLDATWTVKDGDAAVTIIDTATHGEADLIVVGTHGRTGLSRLMLGSVARNVLTHARSSVLVYRLPDEEAHGADAV
ncbi:MAG: universal stress protein [Chloroflexota bacterium]